MASNSALEAFGQRHIPADPCAGGTLAKILPWPDTANAAARRASGEPKPGAPQALCLAVQHQAAAHAAFADLIRAEEPVLRAVALRLCRSPSDASDLVQDALERAWKSFARLPPDANQRAWLVSILRNRFIDSFRRGRRELQQDGIDLAELPAPTQAAAPGWASLSAGDLAEAVKKLPEEFRVPFQLHALEGRSYLEIAARLGIPKATVGTRLTRARRKLRDLLLPRLPQEEDDEA